MKYLILRNLDGTETAYFCLAPLTHARLADQVAALGTTVVSAGFVELDIEATIAGGKPMLRPFGYSESLQLGPREEDAQLLTAFYRVTLDTASLTAAPSFAQPTEGRPRSLLPAHP